LQELKKFVFEAKQAGFAPGNLGIKESDGSKTIIFEKNDWKHHSNYFGGDPYSGREIVLFKGKPIWIMLYYGWVILNGHYISTRKIYNCLREALLAIPEDGPYRGPRTFYQTETKNLIYTNSWMGEISCFSGKEAVYLNDQAVYIATYLGGMIDQKK